MTTPPRAVERILGSLGASPELCDAVVGDLAEEFAMRAEQDDAQAACFWYYREALRSAPYLLRDGLWRLRLADLWRSVGIGLSAQALVVVAAIVVGMVGTAVYGVSAELGMPTLHLVQVRAWAPTIGLAIGAVYATLGGYVAVWLDRRRLLGSALAFASAAIAEHLFGVLMLGMSEAAWYRTAVVLVLVTGALLGGAARVAATERRAAVG